MAEIENIHCPICTQPIPSSWQNGLPPALATSVQRGVTSSTAPTQVSLNVFVWPEGGSTKRNEGEEKVDEKDKDLMEEDKDEVDKKWKCEDELEEGQEWRGKGRRGQEWFRQGRLRLG